MSSGAVSDREVVLAAFADLDAAFDKVLEVSFDALTPVEKLTLQHRMERNLRRAPTVQHRLINALAAEADPKTLGANTWPKVLAEALRISTQEATRRIKCAEVLGPRSALGGEALAPVWPAVAAVQARGVIGRRASAHHREVLR